MWVFFTRRLRLWLLAAVAGPLLGWALNRAGRRLEQRNGESRVSRGLQSAGQQLKKRRTSNGGHTRPVGSGHAEDLASANQKVLDRARGRRRPR